MNEKTIENNDTLILVDCKQRGKIILEVSPGFLLEVYLLLLATK